MSNENSDKIYSILRDVKNNVVTVEDAFARISGLQDASELTEDSYKDNQNTELNETSEEEAVIDRPVNSVQVVQNPENQPEQPDTREVILSEEETEEALKEAEQVEEKSTKTRRKKKTTDDNETDTTTTEK